MQESKEKTQSCQKIKQYHVYDIGVRFKEVSNLLQWEKKQENQAWEEYKIKKEQCNILGDDNAKHNIKEIEEPSVLEEEYTHHTVNFRGMILLPRFFNRNSKTHT